MQTIAAQSSRRPLSPGVPPGACAPHPCSSPGLVLDILVVNAADLVEANTRARTKERIGELARRTTRTIPGQCGPWLLVMTHTSDEREQAYQLALALSGRCCQGVRAVAEGDRAATGQAALAFHRLHFPDVAESLRPSRVLVLGGTRERTLFSN